MKKTFRILRFPKNIEAGPYIRLHLMLGPMTQSIIVYAKAHNHEHQCELVDLVAAQFYQEKWKFS